MIFTFYSFKGGVGRSMALANVAELYYRRGLRVLVVDFDLEAPGLERFCSPRPPDDSYTTILRSRGIIDLLTSYRTLRRLPVSKQSSTDPQPADSTGDLPSETVSGPSEADLPPFPVEPLDNFIVHVYEAQSDLPGSLSIMPAGRRDNDEEYSRYAERVRTFDWDEFFLEYQGEEFFDWFGQELKRKFDVILIDSRTGITEMSGVCTHQLADAVILVVAPNDQNLDGVKRIARSLRRPELVSKGRKGRELHLLVVPSRVESGEGQKMDDFGAKFERELAPFSDKNLVFQTNSFIDLKIPYVTHYAYMEDVAIREPNSAKAADLIAAYTKVASAMMELVPKNEPVYLRYFSSQTQKTDSLTFDSPPADFVGRDSAFAAIADWLSGAQPVMMITGAPGAGKTALAQQLVASYSGKVALPRRSGLELRGLTFAYTCSPDADPMAFVTALAQALAGRVQQFAIALSRIGSSTSGVSMRVQQRIGTSQSGAQTAEVVVDEINVRDISAQVAFRQLVLNPLQTAHRSNGFSEPAVVLIDALDVLSEKAEGESIAALLAAASKPGELPPRVRFLLFSRNDPKVTEIIGGDRHDLGVDPAARDDIVVYADRRLAALELSTRRLVIGKLQEAADGNFLYAKLALDEISSGGGSREELLARVDILDEAKVADALAARYRSFIQQSFGYNLERWSERYRPLLAMLAVSKGGGLTRTQLRGILERQPSEISDALKSVGEYLSTQSAEGPFKLFHSSFGKFLLTDSVYGMERAEINEAIANYFVGEYGGRWVSCQDQYAIRYTAAHYVDAARSVEGRNERNRLLDKLVGLLGAADFLQENLAQAPAGSLLEQIGVAVPLAADEPQRTKLAGLQDFLRAEGALGSTKGDQASSLAERLQLYLNPAAPTPTTLADNATDQPPAEGEAEMAPSNVSPTSGQAAPSLADEEAKLRRSLPTSVRIELNVWRGAKTAGLVYLAVSVLLCAATVSLALDTVYFNNAWVPNAIYFLIVLAALYSMSILYLENRKAAPPKAEAPDASATPSPSLSEYSSQADRPWEALPEVVALRAGGKRFLLFGAISAASPYFEIGTVLYAVTALLTTFSPTTNPLWRFFKF